MRTCLDCGAEIDGGTRCGACARDRDHRRDDAEPWRQAYSSAVYRENRQAVIAAAGGRCTRILPNGRCWIEATETNHIVPLSTARSFAEAIRLCAMENLEAVCTTHNPRGGSR